MTEEQYEAAKTELSKLEDIPWDADGVDWEYIDHLIKSLKADIFAYERSRETRENPYEQGLDK